jgi:hypothetical protein
MSRDSHGAAQTASKYSTQESASVSTTRNYMYAPFSVLFKSSANDREGLRALQTTKRKRPAYQQESVALC